MVKFIFHSLMIFKWIIWEKTWIKIGPMYLSNRVKTASRNQTESLTIDQNEIIVQFHLESHRCTKLNEMNFKKSQWINQSLFTNLMFQWKNPFVFDLDYRMDSFYVRFHCCTSLKTTRRVFSIEWKKKISNWFTKNNGWHNPHVFSAC